MHENIKKIISSVLVGSIVMSNAQVLAVEPNESIELKEESTESNEQIISSEINNIAIDLSFMELVKSTEFDEELLNIAESIHFDIYSYLKIHNTKTDEYINIDKELIPIEFILENPRMGYLDENFNFVPTKSGEIKGILKIKGIDSEKASVPVVLKSTVEEEKGSVEIQYVDNTTKEPIADKEYKVNLEIGEKLDISAINIDGYKLVGSNIANILIEKGNIDATVIFEYIKDVIGNENENENENKNESEAESEKETGSIVVKYIDKSTGKEIAESIQENDKNFGEYKYTAKEIEGYNLIGEKEQTVVLNKENKSASVTFEYEKEVTGTVTIDFIEEGTGKRIKESKVVSNLALGEHKFTDEVIKGYHIISISGDGKVNITKDNLSQKIEYVCRKITKTELTCDKELMNIFLEGKQGMSLFANAAIFNISKDSLEKIAKDFKEINITVVEEASNKKEVEALMKDNGLNVLDSFSISSNLKDMVSGVKLHFIRNQLDLSNEQNFYLYKVNTKARTLDLEYVGEGFSSQKETSFNVWSNSLDGSTFVITSNKRSTDTTGTIDKDSNIINVTTGNTNNNTNNNTNTTDKNENADKDKLPDTSGTTLIVRICSIMSIIGSVFLLKKKRN